MNDTGTTAANTTAADTTAAETTVRTGGCGCGGHHGAGHGGGHHGGHQHGGSHQPGLPQDLAAGRRDLGLTSARPGEGTDPETLANQGPRPGGGCACGRH
ncbi:hypothetical protein [Georgenia yuyongxinii]|uniref:hypothetical protein n=1 Tax=Georgenia yuyongxinii TaxID=2589797 RepID=UPI00163D7CD0|nr:hypothetical protein [Georgenia yuyongxinii]